MKNITFVLLAVLFGGCALLKGEPAATADATPPAGYNPLYMKAIKKITAPPDQRPALYLSRVEAAEPNHIRLYVHLVDSNGNYLSGAANPKFKSMWCKLLDVCNDKSTIIKDYKLREVTESDRVPMAIALVMDHSGSMGDVRAHRVQEAAEHIIDLKKTEDAMAIIKYDAKVGVEAPLTTDSYILKQKLHKNGLEGYGGYTAIGDAVVGAIDVISKTQGYERKAVIVFTDGKDNSSNVARDSVIRYARSTATLVCAVDFGENIDPVYMTDLASSTGGIHEQVYRSGEFDPVFEDVYHKLKNYYVIDYTPRAYGVHTVSLKLCLPKDTAYAEATFDNSPRVGEVGLLDVYFDVDKAELLATSAPALDNAEYILKAYPKMMIELRGHTDNTGDASHNKSLSERRAEAVKRDLVKRGIDASRVNAKGFGDAMPVADNSSDDGRSRNRRTEFVIVSQ